MSLTMLFNLFGCAGGAKEAITSVETMTLTLRGMRGSYVYTITADADQTELRRYREVYAGGETTLVLEASTACGGQEIVELMNACDIPRWNGFHGKHPKHVSDGIMFTFSATVNGGQTISADGSANYPKGYHEFVRTLNAMLAAGEAE